MQKQKELSQGTKLLLLLFSSEKTKIGKIETYETYFSYFFDKEKVVSILGDGSYLYPIYDEIFFEIDNLSFVNDIEDITFQNQLREKIIRKIISFLDYDITIDDANDFLRIVSENRIWSDEIVKKNQPYILSWVYKCETSNIDDTTQININDIDPYSKEFEDMEKAAWKPYVLPQFHTYLDFLDLSIFKRLLVDMLGNSFTPEGWQKEFLVMHKRFNFIAACRRSGKTFLAAYLIIRQLMLPYQSVAIIVPTLDKHAKNIFRYIERYLGRNSAKRGGDWALDKSSWTINNIKTGSECTFYSGKSDDSIRGDYANLLIVDEAAFNISEDMFESAKALIRTVKGMVYVISSVNEKASKGWFYYNLVRAELDMYNSNSLSYARRLDIYDNVWIDDDEKALIMKDKDLKPAQFNAERLSLFGDEDLFDLKHFWKVDEEPTQIVVGGRWHVYIQSKALLEKGGYSSFFISHDPAKMMDKAGMVVLGVTSKGEADIVMAEYIDGKYMEQVDFVIELKKLLSRKVYICLDHGGVGAGVYEMYESRNEYPIKINTIGGSDYSSDTSEHYYVGKEYLLSKLQAALGLGYVRGFSFQRKLRIEFETYDDNRAKKGHHNDILSALMLGLFCSTNLGYVYDSKGGTVEVKDASEIQLDPRGRPLSQFDNTNTVSRISKHGY